MARWTFEPGHTAAEFRARHMMVTYVRGAFKNVHGSLDFDPENPRLSSVEATIDASGLWTGEPQRDAHLRSADFLDVEHHPQITYRGEHVELIGDHDYIVTGELTIRGVTRPVEATGTWIAPAADAFGNNRGHLNLEAVVDRTEYDMNWNMALPSGGNVLANDVTLTVELSLVEQA